MIGALGVWLAAAILPAQCGAGGEEIHRVDRPPNVGDLAPDFELPRLGAREGDPDARVRLSSFRGRRPVVLILSSFT